MSKIMKTFGLSGVVVLAWGHAALAQEQAPAPTFAPVEIYTCNYNEGKGPADLDRVIAGWNKWMDKNSKHPYTAWIMTPHYYGPGFNFDVAWLGAWPDGDTMGASMTRWLEDGGEQAAAFFDVMSCDTHANFASSNVKQPGPEFPGDGLAQFQDCTIAEGRRPEEVGAAYRAWGAYQAEQGSDAGMWLYWPAFAGGPIKFDFKVVTGHSGFDSLGADYDRYGNGGGYRKAAELFAGLVECDSARVYDAKLVRNGMPQQ